MRRVFLHGDLGNSLGKKWELEVNSVQEALWAIEANTSKLTDFMRKNSKKFAYYTFMVGGRNMDKHQLKSPIKDEDKEIHIMPQVAGGSIVNIVQMVAVAIITGMIMQAIFKPPKPKDAVKTTSYIFGGTQNVTNQGIPIPIGYGRLLVGSVVVSSHIRHEGYKSGKGATFETVRVGSYDPDLPPNEQTVAALTPAVFITHWQGGNLGGRSNDIEYDENGKAYIPDYKLLDDDAWDDIFDPFGDGPDFAD